MSDNDQLPYSNVRLFAIRGDRARGKALIGASVLVIVLIAAVAVFFMFLMSGGHKRVDHDAPVPPSSATTSTS
jgi:hypothetical protein